MRCLIYSTMPRGVLFVLLLTSAAPSQAALFYSRPTFELGSQATTAIDFEGLAGPPANFMSFPAGLSLDGVKFTGQIPGAPPTASLFVIDPKYAADYSRGSGDVLSPGTTDGQLIFELPAGTKAVGFDIATFGSPSDSVAFVVASSGGGDPILQFAQASGPASGRAFVGFTSATPIARVTITPSASGITLIDDVRFGLPSPALVAGDANGDGWIDSSDYTLWADHYLQIGRSFDEGDFNADGIVNGGDYTLWADHYSSQHLFAATATPEPSTLALGSIAVSLIAGVALRGRART